MKLKLLSLMVAAATLASACGDDPVSGPAGDARVRFVNVAPGAGPVDLYIDGNLVEENTLYLGASDYLDARSGRRNIEVRLTGLTTTVIDRDVDLAEGGTYSLYAAGTTSNEELGVVEDDQTPGASGMGKLRVIDGSPGSGDLDIYVVPSGTDIATVSPTYSNVDFTEVSPYTELAAGAYRVIGTSTGTKTVLFDSGTISITSGDVLSAVAADDEKGGAPFVMLVLDDIDG